MTEKKRQSEINSVFNSETKQLLKNLFIWSVIIVSIVIVSSSISK